jgi:hypothetical protein
MLRKGIAKPLGTTNAFIAQARAEDGHPPQRPVGTGTVRSALDDVAGGPNAPLNAES